MREVLLNFHGNCREFSTWNYSLTFFLINTQGSDCIEKFADMQICTTQYPELYDKDEDKKVQGVQKWILWLFITWKYFSYPLSSLVVRKKLARNWHCTYIVNYLIDISWEKKQISPAKTMMNENLSKNFYLETCFLNGCGGNGPYCIISRNPANNHQTVRQKLTKTISRRRRKSRSRRKPIPRWQKLRRRQKLNKSRRQRQRPDQKMQRPTIPRQHPKLVNQKWSHLKMCKSIFSFLAVKHFF